MSGERDGTKKTSGEREGETDGERLRPMGWEPYEGRRSVRRMPGHRFSSVLNADRIYVLEQGRIVEQGSHADLMRQQGLYAELFTLQAAAYLETQDSLPG